MRIARALVLGLAFGGTSLTRSRLGRGRYGRSAHQLKDPGTRGQCKFGTERIDRLRGTR